MATQESQLATTAGGEVLYKSTTTDAEMKELQELYKYTTVLSKAGDKAPEHEKEYLALLGYTKGKSNKAKEFAAQNIPRYFKYFPKLSDQVINAQLDLCEEEDLQVRVHAIKHLPLLCKEQQSRTENLPKIADVLGQLLYAEDPLELENVKKALVELLKIDIKVTLERAIFGQIQSTDLTLRDKAITFLKERVMSHSEEFIQKKEDVETFIADNIKKVLPEVSEEQFKMLIDVLSQLSIFNKPAGAKQLLEIIENQADLKSELKPTDTQKIDKIVSCILVAASLLRTQAAAGLQPTNSVILHFIVDKIFVPKVWHGITDDYRLKILKALAEISPYTSRDDAKDVLTKVYEVFKSYLPTAPAQGAAHPELNFSFVECLLYTFHKLAATNPPNLSSLTGLNAVWTGQPSDLANSQKLDDLKERLTYVKRKTEEYKQSIASASAEFAQKLKNATTEEEKAEINKNKWASEQAIPITNNIIKMTAALLKPKPEIFKALQSVELSWRPAPLKRAAEGGSGQQAADAKRRGGPQQPYVPPSRRDSAAPQAVRGGGRGGQVNRGGRGGFRGARRG